MFLVEWHQRTTIDEFNGKEHFISIKCEAQAESEYRVFCRLCPKYFRISNIRSSLIESYTKNKSLKSLMKNFEDCSVYVTTSAKCDCNLTSSQSSSSVTVKLPAKNIYWIPSTLNEK